jgi:3-hydroxyisobutyrate dehydrogenase
MVGGDAEQFTRALPVFRAMGKTVTHVGGQGAGQTVKLVNQVLVVGNCLAMCEALLLAQAGGVDLQKTYDAISQGAAGSWMFTNRAPQIMRRDWRPGFTIDLQEKDLRLVMDAADELGAPLPGTAFIFQLYRTLQAQGLGEEGNHALIKALEHLAGFQIEPVAERL